MNSFYIIFSFFTWCNSPEIHCQIKIKPNDFGNVFQDTSKRPFQIIFNDVTEIAAGSPYYKCSIRLSGTNLVHLPEVLWQDKFTWSDDSKTLILVKWCSTNNNPVFQFIKIDTGTGVIQEGVKMLGAINELSVKGNIVHYNKFYHDKIKSKEKLCCEVEEDYIFK